MLFLSAILFAGCESSSTPPVLKATTANYKKVPKIETDKMDAHEFKKDEVGAANVPKYDIFWDTGETDQDKRNVQLHPKQSGGDLGIHETNYIWSKVKEDYPPS